MILPISVIIPTMNRPDSLNRTLCYMSAGQDIPKQVIIVNQSQHEDLIREYAKVVEKNNHLFSSLVLDYQSIPSITKARNRGFSLATEEIIVFMDDDVDVRRDTFHNVMKLMSDDISMLGGIQEGTVEYKISVPSYILGMGSVRKRKIGHVSRACFGQFPRECDVRTPTEWAMGFFFVVRKSLMEKWNLFFDENLQSYAYAEDLDFTYSFYKRSYEAGYKCFMSKLLQVNHNVSKDYRIPNRSATFMMILHRSYLSNKHRIALREIHNLWCNFGIFIGRVFRKEAAKDLWDAQLFYFQYRKDVLVGSFHSDLWNN